MPNQQISVPDDVYRHVRDNFEKGDRSEAFYSAYRQVHMEVEADA